jgi:hypothetical protein
MNKELTIIRTEAEDYLFVLRKRYLNVLQMIKDRVFIFLSEHKVIY